ncbi:MAG: head GIN domain-containing protein [Burkholderiaceae bacterium]
MRAALSFAVLAAALQPAHADDCAFVQRAAFAGERVAGSGRIVEESRALAGFGALKVAGGVDVELRASGRETVTVRADDNIVPLIETRVDGGTLVIGTPRGVSFRTQRRPRVVVEFVRLGALTVAGTGDVRADRVRGDTFAVSVAGSGDVRIDALDVDSLGVVLAGSGDFTAAGRADEQGFRIRGSGDVRARDLVGRSVKVSIAGSGDAHVHATEELEVAIAGSGDVVYRGTPRITKSIAGSGSVRPAR